jgi:hypothetical protein
MGPYPEPENTIVHVYAERAIVQADANGMNPANALEMERRMFGIGLQELEVLVGKLAN